MEYGLFTLGRLLLCAVDICMVYFFFQSIFVTRGNRQIRLLCFALAAIVIFTINTYESTWLNLMVVPIACLLYVLCVFKLSLSQGIAYTVIFYTIFAGGREVAYEMLFRLLSSLLPVPIPPWFTPGGFFFLIPEYVLSILFLLLVVHSTRKLELNNNQTFAWYLLIMPVSSIIVLCCFLNMDFPDSAFLQRMVCLGAFLLYFSNMAVFLILAKYTSILNKMKYEEMYTMKLALEDEKFQKIARLNERYRNYMHDVHKYLNHFRMLALDNQPKKIAEIIDELEGKMQEGTSDTVYSGNEVLNAILTERALKADAQGIDMSIFVENFLKVDFISDVDMILMFGNLLDNALEAAGKCQAGRRTIDVKLFMGNQYILVLYIENTFEDAAPRDGERLITTKKDHLLHGLGIGIVRKLAEKHGGNLILEEKGDLFVTSLTVSSSSKR